MVSENRENLVRRIAKLAKQNQELEAKIKKLQKETEKLLRRDEKNKLLLEKLSPEVLKKGEGDQHDHRSLKFKMATVLFADIQGFSRVMTDIDSGEYMDELDEVLYAFDNIVEKYNIEKIKTIGDTYMCAGGIPVKNITNPIDVVMAALEMRNFLEDFESHKRAEGERIWDLKIGIHTGPVTAGISGKKKISYDIKGDTVNTASRVETVSDKGHILISVMSYELVKEFFLCAAHYSIEKNCCIVKVAGPYWGRQDILTLCRNGRIRSPGLPTIVDCVKYAPENRLQSSVQQMAR